MPTNTALTLGQAARLTGRGKTTLARAIASGRLSATKSDTGTYLIEPAELARCYPLKAIAEPAGATVAATSHLVPRETIDAMRETVTTLLAEIADLKEQRAAWQAQAERLALAAPVVPAAAITPPAAITPVTPVTAVTERPWWRFPLKFNF